MTQGPETRRLYIESFDLFEKLCRPSSMATFTKATIDRFRSKLLKRRGRKKGSTVSAATVNKHLRHLRVLLNSAHEDGEIDTRASGCPPAYRPTPRIRGTPV